MSALPRPARGRGQPSELTGNEAGIIAMAAGTGAPSIGVDIADEAHDMDMVVPCELGESYPPQDEGPMPG